MISRQIGRAFSACATWWPARLLDVRIHPNVLSLAGMVLTVGAGAAIAAGQSSWRTWAFGLLVAAGACDLLDGAMAKMGASRRSSAASSIPSATGSATTPSTSARPSISSASPTTGPSPPMGRPNVTLVALALAGLVWANLISYIKARAENAGADGRGGFWQRPERMVTLLLGLLFLHVGTAVWILGLWPLTTVAHRLWRAWRTSGAAAGQAGPVEPPACSARSCGAGRAAGFPSTSTPAWSFCWWFSGMFRRSIRSGTSRRGGLALDMRPQSDMLATNVCRSARQSSEAPPGDRGAGI